MFFTKRRRSFYHRRLSYWKNEFPHLFNDKIKKTASDEPSFSNVMKEYARYCTLHGIQYVFKENSTLVEKVGWLIIILISFLCASLLAHTMWLRFSASPTVTAVKDTHLDLYLIPFPAVSICPTDKIKLKEAYGYLSKYVNITNQTVKKELDKALAALSLFQHPWYNRMNFYLTNNTVLKDLASINMTDFMIKVMPQCEELFLECHWIGKIFDCCELFQLQRSEEGFCYSFNSLTSVNNQHCMLTSEDLTNLRTHRYASSGITDECMLRRNSGAGSSTGLVVYVKKFDDTQRIPNANNVTGVQGVRVQIYHVTEYPEAGMGNLLMSKQGAKLSATVKPFITISTNAIRNLDLEVRFCFFPDEQQLSVSKAYTQRSCLLECRLDYLEQMCACRPYFFNMMDNRVPICNSQQLECIAKYNRDLRFFSPPSSEIRGFDENESSLNCSQCLPTCHESIYDIDTDFTYDTSPLAQESYGVIDVFYRNEGAVKYQRDVTFGWIDLLVSFGGIAGLFLGFSILTLVELAYWSVKLIHYNISDRKNKRVHPTEKNLFHSNTSSSSMFQTQDDLDRYPTLPFVY
ncbi:hypothetical protein M8J76_006923 [Diaphorina citri]|nr:hypothetical protein M8J75_015118 [Diaphorina citri]KAI5749383.1 hypothetical protein M8J76_006923 [Diaphorina citri]